MGGLLRVFIAKWWSRHLSGLEKCENFRSEAGSTSKDSSKPDSHTKSLRNCKSQQKFHFSSTEHSSSAFPRHRGTNQHLYRASFVDGEGRRRDSRAGEGPHRRTWHTRRAAAEEGLVREALGHPTSSVNSADSFEENCVNKVKVSNVYSKLQKFISQSH